MSTTRKTLYRSTLAAVLAVLGLLAPATQAIGQEKIAPLVTAQKVVPQPICIGHHFEIQGIFTGLSSRTATAKLTQDVNLAARLLHTWNSPDIRVEPRALTMTFPTGLHLSTGDTYRIDLYDGARRRSTLRHVKIAACTKEGMPLAMDPSRLNPDRTPRTMPSPKEVQVEKNIDALQQGIKTIDTGPHYTDDLAIVSVTPDNTGTPEPGSVYSVVVKVSSNADPNKTIYFWFQQYDSNYNKLSIPPVSGVFRSNYHTVNYPWVKGQSTTRVKLDFPFDSAHSRGGKFYVHIVLSDMRSGSSGHWVNISDPDFTNNDYEFHAP